MHKGLPKYVNVNVGDLANFSESQEISLDSLRQSGHLKSSGREKSLPLKVSYHLQSDTALRCSCYPWSLLAASSTMHQSAAPQHSLPACLLPCPHTCSPVIRQLPIPALSSLSKHSSLA